MSHRACTIAIWILGLFSQLSLAGPLQDAPPDLEPSLMAAKANRPELERALRDVPAEQREGLAFLIANMPERDLTSLQADFLLAKVKLAYQTRAEVPWGNQIPEEIFLNDVLPFSTVDEERDSWRQEFHDLCLPLIKECKTPAEAAIKLNSQIFKILNVKYSTARRAANQGPKESMASGLASCTGLSIILSDACRSVCIPARLVGTPMWSNKRGNHTWVEIWDKDWQFTGACEQDPSGLNRGWFVADAAQALEDSPENAIYAASFRKSKTSFPLVWAPESKMVFAENVTRRYTQKNTTPTTEPGKVRLLVRVLDGAGKRLQKQVTIHTGDPKKVVFEGTSRGESADTNDILAPQLAVDQTYQIVVEGQQFPFKIAADAKQSEVEIVLGSDPGMTPTLQKLAEAVEKHPDSLEKIADEPIAKEALSKAEAAKARELLWQAHVAQVRKTRAEELDQKILKEGDKSMPFFYKTFGDKPKNGRSLWISMHGGGGAPEAVNTQQWDNQKRLYTLDEGVYLAPRAPTNTWNLWHESHIDTLFTRLIEDLIVFEDVDPDRVYVMGYSAGGDGVYQLAPRMADSWAAAGMMAGHPNGVSLLSVRNVPFALQVGGLDAAYNRNQVGKEYGEQLAKLRADDPEGYLSFVKIHDGKGHWMNGEDKVALPWMAERTRNPVPARVVWKQTGTPHDRMYWLAVPKSEAKGDSLLIATYQGQEVSIEKAEGISHLRIHLDDRMLNLDKPITVTYQGKTIFNAIVPRTASTMVETLENRGDPKLVFDGAIDLELPALASP